MSTGFHLLAVVIIWSQRAQAADILVATNTFGSHWLNLAKIAEALTSRGHIVTVVAPASEKSDLTTKWPSFRYETFGDPEKAPLFIEVLKNTPPEIMFQVLTSITWLDSHMMMNEAATDDCQNMLSDIQLLRRLKNSHYNVVLTYPGMSCGSLVAQYLDLPLVCTLMFMPFVLEIQATGVPNPVSYIPTVMLGLTDQMTFLQRVKNTLVYFGLTIMGQVIAERGFDAIASRTIGSNFTIFSALARTDVWLYQTGVMFDYPKPTMPNMVSIAGYMADEAKPLSEDLDSFMQSSGDAGVVIVTFGNLITVMPAERAEMLAAAFSRLPQKVVWRNAGTPPPSLGPNTRIMEWLPQSDLLAHSKTKAFVSHCGYNSISEAMYHGVPLVGMPLFADQHENIARVVARGMAVTLDIHTVTSEEVYQAITAVIFNPKYKEKAKRVSTILRDQPQPPMERAVWWIEHVIKHGGLPHLRSRATELPFYQYYLLDVLALIVSVLAVILLAGWKCCLCACSRCKWGRNNIIKKTN
ncbi:PREDICTED: UDP-glucuronosyltransferase 2C1-like isoform X2 [Branchiostoma belcheri]|uniref:UDP-glucuronosyltransferase n=1 Tax=Branchiostoma belcheri TaxID=7741 RepID=A0A6P4ZKS5_BRABE|nr:PREDICTED: UDP-glucuronosyltransferase 2C1-like isoform X2 [Branchiostoma belcheri]